MEQRVRVTRYLFCMDFNQYYCTRANIYIYIFFQVNIRGLGLPPKSTSGLGNKDILAELQKSYTLQIN